MSGWAAVAGAAWGMFNVGVQNRTQAEYLRQTEHELKVQADQTRAIGASEIRMFQRVNQYRIGAIEAGWGHSGVAADSGSAFETVLAQAATAGLQKLQMQRSTDLKVRDILTTAAFQKYQRDILTKQLPIQLTNAGIQGAASGMSMSGGGSFGSSFVATKPA